METKCSKCIHYKVCDKWWEFTSLIDMYKNEDFEDFFEAVEDENGCELFKRI